MWLVQSMQDHCRSLSGFSNIAFASLLDANFGCCWFRIMSEIVSKLLLTTSWSCSAQSLSSLTFQGQVINLGLLLCTEFTSQHADCSYVPSLLRDDWQWNWMNDQKIALVDNKSLPIPLKFSFHMKKYSVISDLSLPKIYKALKPFWLSNLIINDSSLQQQASPCQQQLLQTWKLPVFVSTYQTCSSCTRALPKELGYWLCSQNLSSLFVFWNRVREWLAMIARWPAGAWTWIQT